MKPLGKKSEAEELKSKALGSGTEADINTVGYQFLQAGKIDEAIKVFKTNTKRFPDSWNAWDSLDRSKHNNLVDAVVAMFNSGEISKIGITPEGTRSYQPNWKTGFHHMATKAGVPIILATFHYPKKLAILSAPFPLTENPEADIERMKDWFRPHKGKNPEDGVR